MWKNKLRVLCYTENILFRAGISLLQIKPGRFDGCVMAHTLLQYMSYGKARL